MTTDVGRAGLDAPTPRVGPATARLSERILSSVAWACAAGLVASLIDAGIAGRSQRAPFGALAVADAGVVAPLSLVVGAGVGAFASFVAPRGSSPASLLRALGEGAPPAVARRGVRMVLLAVFGFVEFIAAAHIAKRALGMDAPPRALGAALAAAVAALAAVAVGASAFFAGAVPIRSARRLSPLAGLLAGVGVVAVLAAYGLATGDTNGGGGVLGILGVLRREELDLRGVGLLALIALSAWIASDGTPRVRPAVLACFAAAPLVLTVRAGLSAFERRDVALAVERGAPLGWAPLAVLRRLSDRDHDGASALFGGGDCNDHDPRVRPGADDLPGNGIDEDCSGSDEKVAAEAPRTAPAAGASSGAWAREHFPAGLSVVLVTVDTLRADLGYAGNPRPVSPAIDDLSRRSVVFDRAVSLASYTGKSMGPLLLGKYPSETSRTFEHFDRFGSDETFVQERLRRAGVRTFTAQGHWYFKPETGLGRGFDDADYSAEPRVPQMEGDRTVNGDKLTDAALALLDKPENVAHPFFFWMHYVDPHAAYVPHAEYDFGSKGRDLYDGEVAFVDHQIGRLLARLGAPPFAGRTAILLTSDHGEAFGEHGLYRHGFEVWEELVHVPLVVYVPGIVPGHVHARRSAVDIVPTVLDLFGLPPPEPNGRDFISGVSLLPDLVAADRSHLDERPVLVDMSEGPHNAERQAFYDAQYKIIASNGRPIGLYDLEKDPGETTDLLGNAALANPVISRFKAFRRTLRTVPPRR